MTAHRPTVEQAERLREAVATARRLPPEKPAALDALDTLCEQTGHGLPEGAMESLLGLIVGIEPPSRTDELLDRLFGPQPGGLFEGVGRLAAVSALLEYQARDLLATLVDGPPGGNDETDAEELEDPNEVLNRCAERSTILGPELGRQVVSVVNLLRQIHDFREEHVHTTWSRYAGGRRTERPPRSGVADHRNNLAGLVEEAAEIAVQVPDLLQQCQRARDERSS